ncbi:MAG: hypothetical protein ACRCT1_04145 [Microcoleaceae cyanobacterium]|jgi:hypothetical protein
MEKIANIDPLGKERNMLSDGEREKKTYQRVLQEKEKGYQLLVELCLLGEYNYAQQLAQKNPHWGYCILEGEVIEKFSDE